MKSIPRDVIDSVKNSIKTRSGFFLPIGYKIKQHKTRVIVRREGYTTYYIPRINDSVIDNPALAPHAPKFQALKMDLTGFPNLDLIRRVVQLKAFELGYGWDDGQCKKIANDPNINFLYLQNDGCITYTGGVDGFNNDSKLYMGVLEFLGHTPGLEFNGFEFDLGGVDRAYISRQLQEFLFCMGIIWPHTGTEVSNLKHRFLHVTMDDNMVRWADDFCVKKDSGFISVDPYKFLEIDRSRAEPTIRPMTDDDFTPAAADKLEFMIGGIDLAADDDSGGYLFPDKETADAFEAAALEGKPITTTRKIKIDSVHSGKTFRQRWEEMERYNKADIELEIENKHLPAYYKRWLQQHERAKRKETQDHTTPVNLDCLWFPQYPHSFNMKTGGKGGESLLKLITASLPQAVEDHPRKIYADAYTVGFWDSPGGVRYLLEGTAQCSKCDVVITPGNICTPQSDNKPYCVKCVCS